jgi:hypothetical protein
MRIRRVPGDSGRDLNSRPGPVSPDDVGDGDEKGPARPTTGARQAVLAALHLLGSPPQ